MESIPSNPQILAPLRPKPRRFRYEQELLAQGISEVAGVDEAGRGPLAGPVVAAAVIFPSQWFMEGLPRRLRGVNDSKQLSEEERESLYEELIGHPEIRYGWSVVEADMIDQINILQATHRAMNGALAQISPSPVHALVDGLPVKTLRWTHTAVVSGDAHSYSIGAASILAKVTRDRRMKEFHELYPLYGFGAHKGYGTPEHLTAIKSYGPCPIHRRTFAPMRPVQGELFA